MILSDRTVRKLLAEGRLQLEPLEEDDEPVVFVKQPGSSVLHLKAMGSAQGMEGAEIEAVSVRPGSVEAKPGTARPSSHTSNVSGGVLRLGSGELPAGKRVYAAGDDDDDSDNERDANFMDVFGVPNDEEVA